MSRDELIEVLESNDFIIHETHGNSAEIEKWTDGGVDMIFYFEDLSAESFIEIANEFDVDEQVTTYIQDPLYKSNFTVGESLEDFTKFHNHLKDIAKEIQNK
jgi:hypothetical protein